MKNLLLVITVVIMLFLHVFVLQSIWNYTVPNVFGVKSVTFIQMFLLLVLANALFKNYNLNIGSS